VRQLTGRLYDHVPPPPKELFQWVRTAPDDRVELWKPIPAGEGWIGSPEGEGHDGERPRHRVKLTRPFAMGAVPVTNAQYAAFDPDYARQEWIGVPSDELEDHPVVNVSWYAATAFCRWLDRNGFAGARLPEEEEWEYACRAGSATRYWSGDAESDLARVGWYAENSQGRTHRVGRKPANAWGLYDVHGNVWEWTLTALESLGPYEDQEDGIEIDPTANPAVASRGEWRVSRGGGFTATAKWTRAAFRNGWRPGNEVRYRGFRVVLPRPAEVRHR
jgi:formylglycine-generating enzyme required for sulfatase activity